MAILSKRLMTIVAREFRERHGLTVCLVATNGDPLADRAPAPPDSPTWRRRLRVALQESVTVGEAVWMTPASGLGAWVLALEDRHIVHGGLVCREARLAGDAAVADGALLGAFRAEGMSPSAARGRLAALPTREEPLLRAAAADAFEIFYALSGWKPELLIENRTRLRHQRQLSQAVEDLRRSGGQALYAFEKERILLANIRAGDRNEARRILNEMLAAIFLSSPHLTVLRARAVELLSCLTRAAIEDNPLLEPLIEKNHGWTETIVHADGFESLSLLLTNALDDFIDGIYLHGANRSSMHVRRALDFIRERHSRPIGLRAVAEHVGLSTFHMAHLFKSATGRSALRAIHEARVQHAQRLLERSDKSCGEIAYEVGYTDQSYFIKHFRRLTGSTPARYRRGGPADADSRHRRTAHSA
jgi:AraC-like DNA-binding protein